MCVSFSIFPSKYFHTNPAAERFHIFDQQTTVLPYWLNQVSWIQQFCVNFFFNSDESLAISVSLFNHVGPNLIKTEDKLWMQKKTILYVTTFYMLKLCNKLLNNRNMINNSK